MLPNRVEIGQLPRADIFRRERPIFLERFGPSHYALRLYDALV
jgi:hypothetical protein